MGSLGKNRPRRIRRTVRALQERGSRREKRKDSECRFLNVLPSATLKIISILINKAPCLTDRVLYLLDTIKIRIGIYLLTWNFLSPDSKKATI